MLIRLGGAEATEATVGTLQAFWSKNFSTLARCFSPTNLFKLGSLSYSGKRVDGCARVARGRACSSCVT